MTTEAQIRMLLHSLNECAKQLKRIADNLEKQAAYDDERVPRLTTGRQSQ